MEDDSWDLQAVVRGCSGSTAAMATVDPFSSSPSLLREGRVEQDDLQFCFPELFDSQMELFELEDLWKPFFPETPQLQQQLLLSPQTSTSSSAAAPLQLPLGGGGEEVAPVPPQPTRQPQQRTLPSAAKSKRRKHQQKKVVCQVPADGLSSDMWAWRKYGQKPIKGSPYPRGYYRCSSSKGCIARKQVERSRTDPDMFVLTYTGEHNHPLPTHRNSLAGSTRHKFPTPSSGSSAVANSSQEVNAPGKAGRCDPEQSDGKAASSSPLSSPAAHGLSPTTPLAASMDDELPSPRRRGGQKWRGAKEAEEEEEEDLLGHIEMMANDDTLFLDLEELTVPSASASGDALSEYFGGFSTPWTANNTAAAAGSS